MLSVFAGSLHVCVCLFMKHLSVPGKIHVYRSCYTNILSTEDAVRRSFTFMLPCIVIHLFLNSQPDALIIQILYIFFWVFPRRQIVVGQLQFDAGEIPRRKYTIFKSRRKSEIKSIQIYSVIKLYMFRASSPTIIRNSLLYIRHWQVSCRFLMPVSKHSQDVPS